MEIKDSLFFASENLNAIIYPVGQHIAIRNISQKEEVRKNDILFIYNDNEVESITSMNISRDNNLLLVCEKRPTRSCIAVYKVSKINFNNVSLFKPGRKVQSTIFSEFTYASFSWDGNFIVSIGKVANSSSQHLQGVVWDVTITQPFKDDNYKVAS